jgi:transcriptional regulator with XRE-family HTH domain
MPKDIVSSIELGKRIAIARIAAGIDSQSELARRLEVSRAAVSQWEKGQAEPSTNSLRRIAMVTAQDLDWLATGRTREITSTAPVVRTVEGDPWPDDSQAKAVAARRPPLEARRALGDIGVHVDSIYRTIEQLSEAVLKGLAFEARQMGDPLSIGISQAVEHRREILARHRTGTGTWFAVVEAIRWDLLRKQGNGSVLTSQKCSSKKEAEEAARRLLAENAQFFSDDTSIEASIACDLEWSEDADA